jgi:hypothetical protein
VTTPSEANRAAFVAMDGDEAEFDAFLDLAADLGEGAAIVWHMARGAPEADVDEALRRQARDLATELFIVAHAGSRYGRAPARLVERAFRAISGADVAPTWQRILAGAFLLGTPAATSQRPDPVRSLLAFVIGWAPDAPPSFRKPTPAMLTSAARVLRDHVIIGTGQKPGPGRVRPWGMAQRFAACFGVEVPDERHAQRLKTSRRNPT